VRLALVDADEIFNLNAERIRQCPIFVLIAALTRWWAVERARTARSGASRSH
jgi:hypothetical protein